MSKKQVIGAKTDSTHSNQNTKLIHNTANVTIRN